MVLKDGIVNAGIEHMEAIMMILSGVTGVGIVGSSVGLIVYWRTKSCDGAVGMAFVGAFVALLVFFLGIDPQLDYHEDRCRNKIQELGLEFHLYRTWAGVCWAIQPSGDLLEV